MIKFFRQSYAIQYVVIALLAIALWIPAFASAKVSMGLGQPVTPLFNLIDGLLGFAPISQLIFAFLLLVLETLIFNAILVNNQIIGKVSTMGAFIFVLLMSLTRTQTQFYPFALSVVFILFAINGLFGVYLEQKPELSLLKVGVFIAFASMCYFPALTLILWVMASLPIAKKSSLRLELIPLTGFLFVYFFYFVGVYLFGDFLPTIYGYRDWFLDFTLSFSGFNLRSIILLSLLIIVAMFMVLGNSNLEKSISVRVKMTMIMLLMLLSLLLLFVGGNALMNGMVFIVLAVIYAYVFYYMNNTGWANLVLLLFMLFVFANKYFFKIL